MMKPLCVNMESSFVYLEFEEKHGHYLARRNKAAEKIEELKARKLPSPVGESPIGLEIAFYSSVLSPEGKDQVGDEMEQSNCRRVVPRSSTIIPNNSKCEEAKG
ncbi:hypothetical protein H5410_045612 [Solanum commersonii]|uniref:Uncharacterized protein n=1 Tax=Solanum commersonii TaxID=4109 RepID=A0A9J5XBM9_SOLCO|nr:hypothetical protein H5410_045612 [Solanum commersonii]